MPLRFAILASLLSVSLLFTAGCRRAKDGAVNVMGSTSIQPFAEILAQEYNKQDGHGVEVQGGGSKAGLEGVKNGIADIGMCSRELKADDPDEARCEPVVIAYDGLAVVVHPSNPVRALSRQQVALIFSGDITNWKELGGEDRPIHVITREEGSGTREAFAKLVMHEAIKGLKKKPVPGLEQSRLMTENGRIFTRAVTQESNGAVKELVRADRGSIGYMSLGLVTHDPTLAAVSVDSVPPTKDAVRDGSYKLKRPFIFAFRKGEVPSAGTRAFTEYVLSEPGQQLLEREGLVSVPSAEKKLPWPVTAETQPRTK